MIESIDPNEIRLPILQNKANNQLTIILPRKVLKRLNIKKRESPTAIFLDPEKIKMEF